MIVEEEIEIQMHDGVSTGYLYRSRQGLPLPGILHLTDITGIRPATRKMAKRLSEQGYCVLLPNVCYRSGAPPLFDFTPDFKEDRTRKRFLELIEPLTPEAVERDAVNYIEYLDANTYTSSGKFGVIGYCFTGAIAMRIAAAMPTKISAVASFHGGGLFTDAPNSPHLLLPMIQSRLYFGHAENDASMNETAIQNFEQALKTWAGKYESETYKGAAHGWTISDRPVYNEALAERAFIKLSEFFESTLKKAFGYIQK